MPEDSTYECQIVQIYMVDVDELAFELNVY
jgi:hypothetical protein